MTPSRLHLPLADRALICVGGEDAEPFLQGLISCDVRKVGGGKASLGALLNPQGKFLFDFFLVKDGRRFLLDTEAVRAQELIGKLKFYRLRARVEIERRAEWGAMAVWEEDDPELPPGTIAVADPRHPAMGWRLYGPVQALPAATGTREEYERRRIALGLPDGSRDAAVEKTFLLENGYDRMGGVDFDKGCYIGQEVTARTKHRGGLRKHLFIVEAEAPLPAQGTPLLAGDTEIGEMRSSCATAGLALVRADLLEAAQHDGQSVTVGHKAVRLILPWWRNPPPEKAG